MKLDVPYKEVLSLNNSVVQEFVGCMEDVDFFSDTRRQKMGSLDKTPSILLRHSEGYIEQLLGNSNHNKSLDIVDFPLMEKYKTVLDNILNELKKRYVFSDYACVIAKLIPNSEVGRHKDSGLFLETCHRIHVPLISDSECIYEVGGTEWHMEVGKVYEIDNTRHHSCRSGSKPRIHLIINLYP
jgi:hypothetical protein